MEAHPYYSSPQKNSQGNIFLTTTHCVNHPTKIKFTSSSKQRNFQINDDDKSTQYLRRSILDLIIQLKSVRNYPEIIHLFNEILHGIDSLNFNKTNIDNIASNLKEQKNIIKLNRLFIKLNNLKRDFLKKIPSKELSPKKSSSSQCFRRFHPLSSKHSLNASYQAESIQNKENQQLKQKLANQISYRQRLDKIKSQSQKHSNNKQQIINKQLQKVKEMNKKVKETYEKNKRLHKQKISKYKYQQLFDPEQISSNIRKRGEIMNFHSKNQSFETSQLHIISEEFLTQPKSNFPKSGILKDIAEIPIYNNNSSKNNLLLGSKDFDSKNSDSKTFKSLGNLINQVNNCSKSFKSIKKDNIQPSYNKISLNTKSYYYTPVNKSYSFDKSLNNTLNNDSNDFSKNNQVKLQLVKEKKRKLQQQRFNKIIMEVVEKQKRILKIHQKKTMDSVTKKKNSPNNSQEKENKTKSAEISPSKSLFKKVIITRRQLMDKQKGIFTKIQNKITNKNNFLQDRVNKIKQRLQKEDQIKLRNKQYWNQYISLTENVSAFHSKQDSPTKIIDKTNLLNNSKTQQTIIKTSIFSKIKQAGKNQLDHKFSTLSLKELKKKLSKLEIQQKNASRQNIYF